MSVQVIVVDNASSDGTSALIGRDYPSVDLISLDENVGFARGNNRGLEDAEGEFILFLNPDTRLDPGSLRGCIELLQENRDVGLVGCRLYNDSGTQKSYFWPHRLLSDLGRLTGIAPIVRALRWRRLDPDAPREVGGVVGAFMMMPRNVLEETGAFPDDVFMYGEDVDLAYRVGRAGFRTLYLPGVSCYHIHNASGVDSSDRLRRHFGAVRDFYVRYEDRLAYIVFLLVLLGLFPVRYFARARGLSSASQEAATRAEVVYAEEAWSDLRRMRSGSAGTEFKRSFSLLSVATVLPAVALFVLFAPVLALLMASNRAPESGVARVDLFAPWVLYPAAFTAYYFIGLALPLDYVGGRVPWWHAFYYLLGLWAYFTGVALVTRTIRREPDHMPSPERSQLVRTRAGVIAGILGAGALFAVFGNRGADYAFRFVSAPGWLFYVLFLLITALIAFTVVQYGLVTPRRALYLTAAASVIGIVGLLPFGSRSPIALLLACLLVAYHYVVQRVRPKVLVRVVLAGVLLLSLAGYVRAVANPGRAATYAKNAERYGIPAVVAPAAPALLAVRNGPGHLQVISEIYGDEEPYLYGRFSTMSLLTLLPGKQPLPGHILTETLFDRSIEEMGQVAPGVLGGFYVDGGWIGILVGMVVTGILNGAAYRWYVTRRSYLTLTVYAIVLSNQLLWIYGNFLTNPMVVWMSVLAFAMLLLRDDLPDFMKANA